MTTVLVTGTGGAAGVAVARSLRSQSGLRVVAADCDPHAAGLDLAHQAVVLPSAHSPRFGTSLIDACRKHSVDALVVTVAEELAVVAAVQETLSENGTAVWLPEAATVELCNDKLKFAQHLRDHGVCTPETSTGSDADQTVAGPWIVKPRQGRGSRDVYLADDTDDLRYALRRVQDPIVQTRIAGREFTADVLVARDGAIAGISSRWRLATKGGISTSGVTFKHPAVTAIVSATVQALGYRGIACVQGFLTDQGDAVCIEVNPRFGGGVSLSIAAGADFAGEFVRATLGRTPRTDALRAATGVRMARYFDEIYTYAHEADRLCA